jgi:peroxiredoxin
MGRMALVGIAVAVVVATGAALAADVTVGPSPSWYRPLPTPLSDKPAEELKAQPTYTGTPLYGAIKLGDGADNTYTIVVDLAADWSAFTQAFTAAQGKVDMKTVPARIYIDANNDEDLTNDGDGVLMACGADRAAKDAYIIQGPLAKCAVTYADGTELDYPIGVWMFPQRGTGNNTDYGRTLFFRRACSFETKLPVAGEEVLARFYDENANGLIVAADGDMLAIDLNQDGKLDAKPKGPETYAIDAPFNFKGESYVLKSTGPRGNDAVVAVSEKKVEPPVYPPTIAVGEPAPDFTMATLDGGTFKLSDQKGKVVLIDFWATWCGPCRVELPNVVKMWNEVKDKGLVLVGISLDRDTDQEKAVDTVKKFAPENGMTWTHIVDGKYWQAEVAQLYQVEAIPQTVLVGKDGKIVALGLRGEKLAEKVKELLGQ